MPWNSYIHAPQLLSPCAKLLHHTALQPVLHNKRSCCKEEQPLLAMGACVARESPRAAKKTQGSQKITLTRTHLQPSFSRKEGIEWKLHNMVHDQRLVQKTRLQEIGKVSFSIGILELWNPGILELEDLGSRLPQCLHF